MPNEKSEPTDHTTPGKEKVIFAISAPALGEVPTIVMGVSKDAWEYMKDGMCHTFDLTSANIPVKLILFGAATQEDCLKMISPNLNAGTLDARDWSIKDKAQ